jgi:hypothetical protein
MSLGISVKYTLGIGLSAVLLCVTFGNTASAHHSRAGYDTDAKIRTMKGVVVEYKWRNPHVFIVWNSSDESGKVNQWTGELSSVTTMIAEGMNRESLKPGDELMLTIVPAKDGTYQSLIQKAVKMDGKVVVDLSRKNIREP